VKNEEYVEQHPALQEYLQQHPGVQEEFSENPARFMRQERSYDRLETRREMTNMDAFLDSHPEIAEQVRKDPSLMNDKKFLKSHPALQEFLQSHGNVAEDVHQNPQQFMQEQQRFETREDGRRFDQQPDGRDRDMTRGQTAGMDRFLDSHPEIAEQLRKNPALVNDGKFVHQHPALQSYLQQHPDVREEFRENPNAFMQQEQRFEQRDDRFNQGQGQVDQRQDGRGMMRGQLASMDRFLDSHPEVAEQLRKDPSLVNDKKFVQQHPALQSYLQQHPGVREEFGENPNAFMQREQRFDQHEQRFDQREGFEQRGNGGFDRDAMHGEAANFGEFLGAHANIAAQISKDPSLVNNKEYMENHPELQQYMKAHPTAQAQLQQNPQAFMQSAQQVSKPAPKAPTVVKPAQKQQ